MKTIISKFEGMACQDQDEEGAHMKRGVLVAGGHGGRVRGQALLSHDVRDCGHSCLPLVAGRCCQQHAALLLLLLSTAAQPCNTTSARTRCLHRPTLRSGRAGPCQAERSSMGLLQSKLHCRRSSHAALKWGELQDSGMRLIDRLGLMLPGTFRILPCIKTPGCKIHITC